MSDSSVWPPPPSPAATAGIPTDPDSLLDAIVRAPKNRPISVVNVAVAFANVAGKTVKDPAMFANRALAQRGLSNRIAEPAADPRVPAVVVIPWRPACWIVAYLATAQPGLSTSSYPLLRLFAGAAALVVVLAAFVIAQFYGRATYERANAARDAGCNANGQYDPILALLAASFTAEPFPVRRMAATLLNCTGLPWASAWAATRGYCRRHGLPGDEAYADRLAPYQAMLYIAALLSLAVSRCAAVFGMSAAGRAGILADGKAACFACIAAAFAVMAASLWLDQRAKRRRAAGA